MGRHRHSMTHRVATEDDRLKVIEVLRKTYATEKGWIAEPESQIPFCDLNADHIVRVDDKANTDRTVIHLTNGESIPVEGKDRARLWDILSQSTLLPTDKDLL